MPLSLESVDLLENVQIASAAVAVIVVETQQYRLQKNCAGQRKLLLDNIK